MVDKPWGKPRILCQNLKRVGDEQETRSKDFDLDDQKYFPKILMMPQTNRKNEMGHSKMINLPHTDLLC